MKREIICSLILLLLLLGCINSNQSKPITINEEQKKSDSVSITWPKLSPRASSEEIRITCDSVTTKINKTLPKLKKIEKKITLYNVPNTPVSIWYSKANLPVKIEHAVANESKEFTGKFHYYFINGNLWYSNQIYAKYIFENNQLSFWLNEHWNINEVTEKNYKDREKNLQKDIAKLLTKKE
ncbi:MAG: hypothetical protein R6V37_09415 [Psychroflexus maritimus]